MIRLLEMLSTVLKSFPQVLQLFTKVISWISTLTGKDRATAIAESGMIVDRLVNARTKEDYERSAKDLADLLSHS